jgi:hypothetical protein
VLVGKVIAVGRVTVLGYASLKNYPKEAHEADQIHLLVTHLPSI